MDDVDPSGAKNRCASEIKGVGAQSSCRSCEENVAFALDAVSLAGRWEGIPSHDLIGGSDGYRLPGYSVSIEPGVSISRGKDSLAVSVPVAGYRRGLPAVPDVRIPQSISRWREFCGLSDQRHLFTRFLEGG